MQPYIETDQLAELIGVKQGLLLQLIRLSQGQLETISHGDTTLLLRMLAAKQKMLDQLNKIERKLDPFRNQDPEMRRWRSAEDRQLTADGAQRCEMLLRELMSIEKQGESALRQRRDDAAQQLKGVHCATEARNAYFRASNFNNSKLDVSSES